MKLSELLRRSRRQGQLLLVDEHISLARVRWHFAAYEGEVAPGQDVSRRCPVWEWEGDNLITTAGKGLYLDRLLNALATMNGLTHTGVGTSATAAAIGDTQLIGGSTSLVAFDGAPNAPVRVALVETHRSTFGTGVANFNWQEGGSFNGSVNGTSVLFNRIAPIGAFNKTSAVSIVVVQTITQS